MKNQRNHARDHLGLMLRLVGSLSAAAIVLSTAGTASAQVIYPSWTYTGNLNMTRDGHTATALGNGKVLVAGGSGDPSSAELYDPATGTWSTTGSLNTARIYQHTATLLQSGQVLIAGGFNNCSINCSILNSAELYDPVRGTWSRTGNLNTARRAFTATLLSNGKVLVAGGYNDVSGDLSSAELYDPATGRWSNTGNLITPRGIPTATLLPNGKVLVAGGEGEAFNSLDSRKALDSTELYDPATGKWSSTSNLGSPREFHTATLLPNGKVLIAGGQNRGGDNNDVPSSAELYDPATGMWSSTGSLISAARIGHTATLLLNGKVLVVGGSLNVELYDPFIGTWSITAYLNTDRNLHTATMLANGKVLVAGGARGDDSSILRTELYDGTFSPNSTLIDDAQFFVRAHYVDFLNREPETDGLAYWTNEITKCGSDTRCFHERRIAVSAAFFIEQEFQESGYFVYRFYKASFGRQPNYSELTADRSSVGCDEGYCFADYWVQRPAFEQAYPATMSNTEFVNKLFDTAGLTASIYDAQRQQQIQAMNAGRNRATVLSDVIEIPDFKNTPDPNSPRYAEIRQTSQYNPAFVLMQYFGYLRRNVDQDGYDFWLDVVNNREPNNYHSMVCAFITSREYQLRFGATVTRTNQDCGP